MATRSLELQGFVFAMCAVPVPQADRCVRGVLVSVLCVCDLEISRQPRPE